MIISLWLIVIIIVFKYLINKVNLFVNGEVKVKVKDNLIIPIDIAIDNNGYIFVADYNNHRIQVFNSEGQFIRQWMNGGNDELQFNNPSSINGG